MKKEELKPRQNELTNDGVAARTFSATAGRPANPTPGDPLQASQGTRQSRGPTLPPPKGLGVHGVPDLRFAMSYKEPAVESSRVMMQFFKALCARDLRGMGELCHYPLGSYEGTTGVLVDSLDELMAKPLPSINTMENPERWTDHDGYITPGTYDVFHGFEILNSDAYAANVAMTYQRYTKDGKLAMQCDGVYCVTNCDGKWGINLMSTIFKPADLVGITYPNIVQAALFTRIQHDIGPNTNDSDADIGDRQPGLSFGIRNPSGFDQAQMTASKQEFGGMSTFRTMGVKSRLTHSVAQPERPGELSGDAGLNVRASGGDPNNQADVAKYKDDWKWYADMYERTGLGKWGWTIGYLPYSRVVHHTVDKAHVFSGLTRYVISGEIHDSSAELSIVTWKKGRWAKAGGGAYITMHDRANDAAYING